VPVAPSCELFDRMRPKDRPSPETQYRWFAARPAARKRVALPYADPVRAPIPLDDSESDGEDFNVPGSAQRRKWMFDVEAVDGESP
jgi:hypothetical protein